MQRSLSLFWLGSMQLSVREGLHRWIPANTEHTNVTAFSPKSLQQKTQIWPIRLNCSFMKQWCSRVPYWVLLCTPHYHISILILCSCVGLDLTCWLLLSAFFTKFYTDSLLSSYMLSVKNIESFINLFCMIIKQVIWRVSSNFMIICEFLADSNDIWQRTGYVKNMFSYQKSYRSTASAQH
jgi:hypothetical protein